MAARKEAAPEREMVVLLDPQGNEFETGDPGMIHSLRAHGYSLKPGTSEEQAMAIVARNVEAVSTPTTPTITDK